MKVETEIKEKVNRVAKIDRVVKEKFVNLENSKNNEKDFSLKLKIINILKTLRKPYLSLFLASTMLFYSCNGNELIQNNETDNLDLTEFVNTNLSNNSFDTKLNSVSYFKLADYSEYTQK